ncbi:MAG: hypothetical protein ACJAXX_003252 [Roseivirga sp.]|jgi:hypothetical protein
MTLNNELKSTSIKAVEELDFIEGDLTLMTNLLLVDSLLVVNKRMPNPYYYTVNSGDAVVSSGEWCHVPEQFSEYS